MISCSALWLASWILAAPTVDFDTQIMPVLTKAGCNTGACHGAALGQGGFKLSLLGQSPADDYQTIVQAWEGRRVNLAHSAQSLLILKPTERVEHAGGQRLTPGSEGESLLTQWIAAGAPRLQTRRLVRWDVEPRQALLDAPQDSIRLRVTAHFDQGPPADVTRWTVLAPDDAAALAVDQDGRVLAQRRGVHLLVLRYLDRVAAVQVLVPLGQQAVELAPRSRDNAIDREVLALLQTLRVEPLPPADDATFLRRARLDLTGRLPTSDEVRSYLGDMQPDKRERLIKRLLGSAHFIDFWSHKFSRWLRIDSRRVAAETYYKWLRARISENIPLDRLAVRLLEGEGDSFEVGPANFARATPGPREQAEHVSQLFMGVRLGCANCHNHPLDHWTQDDYHGLAALFARLQRDRHVRWGFHGEVTHPITGRPAVPKLPSGEILADDRQYRQRFSAWLTGPENPYFARAWANRLWREMFGRGLVEPVDDMRDTNPASHPQLLDLLAAELRHNGFNLRALLGEIALSETYGRAATSDDKPSLADRYYASFPRKDLEPEILADVLSDVTNVPNEYKHHGQSLPHGTRAVWLYDLQVTSESLEILGRCQRADSCDTLPASPTLAARLHQINGPLVNGKIVAPDGVLQRLLNSQTPDESILDELYLRALSRWPTGAERGHWLKFVAASADESERRQRWEDFLWALLNCREFTTIH